jgi:hypothetical protein
MKRVATSIVCVSYLNLWEAGCKNAPHTRAAEIWTDTVSTGEFYYECNQTSVAYEIWNVDDSSMVAKHFWLNANDVREQ